MTTTIQVSRGLRSPIRPDVLTALKPFGVKILAFDCWGGRALPLARAAVHADARQ